MELGDFRHLPVLKTLAAKATPQEVGKFRTKRDEREVVVYAVSCIPVHPGSVEDPSTLREGKQVCLLYSEDIQSPPRAIVAGRLLGEALATIEGYEKVRGA